ncbi:MAG TPA: Gldg family protein [Myxococcota bacterium]|nr:Gldg family protein [Myxococcota bacterium]
MTGLPSLLLALGLVGFAFGLLSLVLGLFSGTLLSSDIGWIATNLVLGVALLLTALVLNWSTLRQRMSSGEARRAGRYGSSAMVGTLVAIAILGMLGFLSTRYSKKFDWTESGIHTLSDQSQKVLSGLDQDVQVLALVAKVDAEPVHAVLDKYADASSRFKVEYADPNVRPGLLEKYGIQPTELGHALVRIAIGGESVKVTELTEEKITNAIVKLSRTGQKNVYFLEGHGERPIDGEPGAGRDGYARAAEALRDENYNTKTLLLASTGEVPADANVVIVAGPRRPMLPEETKALEAYLARGGALLAMVDPRVHTEFVQKLAGWGVELGDDVVIDRTLALFGRAMSPFAGSYDSNHEITRGIHDPTLFQEVRSVKAGPGFTPIVFTGDESWAERNLAMLDNEGKAALDDGDLKGPVPVGAAGRPNLPADVAPPAEPAKADGANATPPKKDPRLVVYGDADFADNEFIDAYSDRNLFVNSVNWLIGDVEAISIRPAQSRASRFQLTAEQFRSIRSLSLFVLPELIAVLGVFTWWSRRRATPR